jgi:NAD(P)-dependent dehydrogenase (short-subunit alcohol dehydrogenase family)
MVDTATSMAGKYVLITGGSAGIGRATAIGLAALGARVAITGRDQIRAEATATEIRAATSNPHVDAFSADLSSQAEVRRLAAEVLARYPRLDALVNNVGGFWASRRVTADGLEHTFAVNHLAAFLLTELLLDRLKASVPARIVVVSSNAQSLGKIDFEDLQGERRYSGQDAYNQSKLASVMFTFELARRLAGTGVTANVLHPGVVNSAFGSEDPSRIFKFLVPLWRPFMKTPRQGAATSIYLASSPEVEGVTGTYFANGRPGTPNRASLDADAAARLWQVSARLAGLEAQRPGADRVEDAGPATAGLTSPRRSSPGQKPPTGR